MAPLVDYVTVLPGFGPASNHLVRIPAAGEFSIGKALIV